MVKRRLQGTLREQLNELFSLHWGERRGMMVLMFVVVLLALAVVVFRWLSPPPVRDPAPLRAAMEAWAAEQAGVDLVATEVEYFPFDPNALDRAGWMALGLSERQAESIERFMAKGGRFRSKRDVARLYSLKPGQFEAMEPWILLPDSLPARQWPERPRRERPARHTHAPRSEGPAPTGSREPSAAMRKVEVNSADSSALVALPGIGPAFAKGIIRYRDLLGGYVSLDQLAEVHVLKDKPDALERVRSLLTVDTLLVDRISINTCTVEELAGHPYVRWSIARPLIAYRAQHGPFAEVAAIRGCLLIDEDLFRKLAPYLSVE